MSDSHEIADKKLSQSIGAAIARQRLLAQFTQEEVAEKLGVGAEAVSRMERGAVMPTVKRLIELAQIFACPAANLLEQASNKPSEQASFLEKQLARLKTEDREMLVFLLEKLSARLVK